MSGPVRGFRFRFYPTLKQRRYLARAFGTARQVFDWGLAKKREAYAERKESIGCLQRSRMLTGSVEPRISAATRRRKDRHRVA